MYSVCVCGGGGGEGGEGATISDSCMEASREEMSLEQLYSISFLSDTTVFV